MKIKPLRKKYRVIRRLIRKVFGIKPRATEYLKDIDEAHLLTDDTVYQALIQGMSKQRNK